MLAKTLRFQSPANSSRNTSPISLFHKIFRWRWTSILLLGLSSNLLINIILDYKYQRPLVSFSVEEYINAIIAAIILLEGTRFITRRLDSAVPWSDGVRKRLIVQLTSHLLFLILIFNLLLISITYFLYGGFYSFSDLIVINISVVSLVFFFSLIDTGIYFFNNWKDASVQQNANRHSSKKPIRLSMGKAKHLVVPENIRCAIGQSGLVMIVTNEGRRLPYPQSLDTLMTKLDPHLFFRANRQTILSHATIKSIAPLDYGKVRVRLVSGQGHPDEITISRTRAAEFRKWLKSQVA